MAAAAKPIKVGVIGLGRSGYSIHIHRMRGDKRFQITAVTDWIPERMDEVAAEFGCTTHKNHRALLREADAEVVVVATYSDTHAPVARDVLKAGFHCICEKPIADSVAAAQSIVDAAEKAKKKILFHHNYRFASDARHILDVINSKRIGDVFEVLENEGVEKFVASWSELLESMEARLK